ncbi:transferase [Streptomyces roseochromogenus]|nr:transferase [Streptomyces roseochromogenus]
MPPILTDLSRDPWLRSDVDALIGANMPAYMSWESPGNWRWHGMYDLYPAHQLCLLDGDGRLLAAANGLPIRWDGSASSLPNGSDEVLVEAVDHGPPDRPDAVCMLSVSVDAGHRAAGLAELLLGEVRRRAAEDAPRGVVIPVRPTRKPRYPLIPIDVYAAWCRPDGSCFDPWLRTHLELGATRLGIAEKSLVIRQPVSRWEEFLGHPLPGPGDHPLPGALVPLRVTEDGYGTYAEPNVWVHHPAGLPTP